MKAGILLGLMFALIVSTPHAQTSYTLMVSSLPDRSAAIPLQGVEASGFIYAFVSPATGVKRVDFYLDDPNRLNPPILVEGKGPWDFAGTASSGLANGYDVSSLSVGTHTITALVVPTKGSSIVVSSSFNVPPARPDQVHLAWVDDPATSLNVIWRTLNTGTPSTVEYRTAGAQTWQSAAGGLRTSGATGTLHEVNITGLTPATTYEYRVSGDNGTWSPAFRTRTAPAPGPADFDAVFVADIGLAGRPDGQASGTPHVLREIAALDPSLILLGGNFAFANNDARFATVDHALDAWFVQMQGLGSRAPMMPAYGNHEILVGEGYQYWEPRFATPEGFDNRRNYSFDVGDAHFISIFAVSSTTGISSAALAWLEADLAAAQAAGKRWIIPYFHVSPFADGTNHPSNTQLRAQLGPLFQKYGVKVALSAHDQAYERSYPLTGVPSAIAPTSLRKSCFAMTDGVTWVKSSPGGKLSPSFSTFASEPAPAWTAVRNNTLHNFVRLQVRSSGELEVRAYGVKADGSAPVLIDSFEYTTGSCGPELYFDRPGLRFGAAQGGSAHDQVVQLNATHGLPPSLTVTDDASWLTTSALTGTLPENLTVSVDTTGLSVGTHRAKLRATAEGHTSAELDVVLSVLPANTTHQVMVSTAKERTNAVPLHGATVQDTVYIFVAPDTDIARAKFYLDDPNMARPPFRIENAGPWDFNGTTRDGFAIGFDTRLLGPGGAHTITVATDSPAGATTVLQADFVVIRPKALLFGSSSTSLALSANARQSVNVALDTTDGLPVAFTIAESASWLTVSPQTGTTPATLALTADTAGLPDGTYTAPVTATASGYITGTHTVQLTVGAGGTGAYELLVSTSPDRSAPRPLSGATLFGNIYVFTSPSSGVSEVRFFLDDPQRAGAPFRIEGGAPHDLMGSGAGTDAAPYDTRLLPNGPHNITAQVIATTGDSVVLSGNFTVDQSALPPPGCSPVPCEEILISIPYGLDFGQNHGKVLDGFGVGTGFTTLAKSRNGGGYRPQNIAVDAGTGRLRITTTSGSNTSNLNNQHNGLGVGVDAPSQVTRVTTVLVDPPAGSGKFEQAGLWFGNDDDNFLKLVVLSTTSGRVIEYSMEVAGAQVQKVQSGTLNLTGANVMLSLKADPRDRKITAFYSVNGANPVIFGSFTAPAEFFSFDGARIDPAIGTDTFTGIFATHRTGPSPLVYTFDEFSVTVDDSSPPPVDPAGFTKTVFDVNQPTNMAWGPDDRLYVTELLGRIHAFSFGDTKQPIADEDIGWIRDEFGPRLMLGIAVDPLSTPNNVILWVAHSNGSMTLGEPNSGIVSRLSGPNHQTVEHVITGLPRAIANHGQNSLHFGPDGRLYMAVGGNTGAGAPNTGTSEFGDMQEQPLSAAILVADVHSPTFDGSCGNPDNIFGPPPCDVVPYATGLRNSYDFVFHSNGSMYATDNGLGVEGTFPTSPTAPCLGFANTAPWNQGGHNPGEQQDELNRIIQGGYYGHPNPYRAECVFKDGSYQGVAAPPNYVPAMFELGMNKSANGIVEYTHEPFFGALKNELLIANYSVGDDITRLKLSPDGGSVISASTLVGGLNDPLPMVVGPDGSIYVGELGGDQITVLDPRFGRWFAGKSMTFKRHELGITAIGEKLYVIGGDVDSTADTKIEEYDTTTGNWRTLADMPEGLDHIGVAAVNGKIYVLGGAESFPGPVSSDVYEFDPALGTLGQWRKISDMPQPVGGAAVGAHNGFIYVAGGFTGHHDASLTAGNFWRFDPATGSWLQLPDIPTYRDHVRGEFIGGKFYVVGGRQDGQLYGRLGTLEAYDPATNTWSTAQPLPDMPTPRRGIGTAVVDGRLLVFGGEKIQGVPGEVFREVEEFDPATKQWRNVAPMRTPRHTPGAVNINGRVYVVGGSTIEGSKGITNMMEIFTFSNRP